jgi:hypothetical protein
MVPRPALHLRIANRKFSDANAFDNFVDDDKKYIKIYAIWFCLDCTTLPIILTFIQLCNIMYQPPYGYPSQPFCEEGRGWERDPIFHLFYNTLVTLLNNFFLPKPLNNTHNMLLLPNSNRNHNELGYPAVPVPAKPVVASGLVRFLMFNY